MNPLLWTPTASCLRRIFFLVFVTQSLVSLYFAVTQKQELYDEPEQRANIVLFAEKGWSMETMQNKPNYAATLSYYIPALIYRINPSWIMMRLFSWMTAVLGFWIAARLAVKTSGSYLTGIAILAFPYNMLYLSVFMTEGFSLFMAGLGILIHFRFAQKDFSPIRGWGYSLISGFCIGLSIVLRLTWGILLGAMAMHALIEWIRKKDKELLIQTAFTCMTALTFFAGVVYSSGGILVGGGNKLLSPLFLPRGAWLYHFVCFIPLYGGVTMMFVSAKMLKRGGAKSVWVIGVIISILFSIIVQQHPNPFTRFGNGPMHTVLSLVVADPLQIFFYGFLSFIGIYALIRFMQDLMKNRGLSQYSGYFLGALTVQILILSLVRFPSPFYERYMFNYWICFCWFLPYVVSQSGRFLMWNMAPLFLFQVILFYQKHFLMNSN